MRKVRLPKSAIILITIFFLSCTAHGILKYEREEDQELNQLLRNLPSSDLYPDAKVIYVLDGASVEVSEDGSSRRIDHTVIKILKDSGKEFADIEIGFDSRPETPKSFMQEPLLPRGKSSL